jgi:hypothetical protein
MEKEQKQPPQIPDIPLGPQMVEEKSKKEEPS